MSWAENTKLRFKFFALGMSVMCPVFLVVTFGDSWRQFRSESWPSVEGKVNEIVVKPWQDDKKQWKYFGRVSYTYSVDGREYTTDLTNLGPGTKRQDMQQASNDVIHYQPGMQVQVYYDPSDPSVGVLEKGVLPLTLYLNIGLIIATVVCWIASFFTIRNWLRSRQNKNVEPT